MNSHRSGFLKNLLQRSAAPLLRFVYGGIGSIIMLHRVTEGLPGPRIEECRRLMEISPGALEKIIFHMRKLHYTFINMDEVVDILKHNRRAPKFAVITIDDGFRDTYDTVFPMLTQMGVPFTLYLTTGVPDKTVIPWAYLLEQRLLNNDSIHFDFNNKRYGYEMRDESQRERVFWSILMLFEDLLPDERNALFLQLFGEDAIREKVDELAISWEQLEEMSKNSLVTIGSHTVNHPKLSMLDRASARREMADAKALIESHLKTTVQHFSYPFGSNSCSGAREFQLAREVGYKTATTTRLANIFPAHKSGLHCLPRVYGANIWELELALTGSISAFRYRGKRGVMA